MRKELGMPKKTTVIKTDLRVARRLWGAELGHAGMNALRRMIEVHAFSVVGGDLILINGRWYVTHTGLLGLARRNRCAGMHIQPVPAFCDPAAQRWAFQATVYKSKTCRGFVGYGDADPSNVSPTVHGAEMRVAETRAVNRALRKAYGIGICSVEEVGSLPQPAQVARESKKLQAQPANGNYGGRTVRDRLCQIIRQHQLDANLVKSLRDRILRGQGSSRCDS
jgi:hypothetical protein